MKRRAFLTTFVLVISAISLYGQTLTQIGYKIKSGLSEYDNYVVLVGEKHNDRIISEAKSAQLILKKNFTVHSVSYLGDMKRLITDIIRKKSNLLVISIADEDFMNQTTVRWLSQQLTSAGIPLVSTRPGDTMCGALLTIAQEESQITTHLNKIILSLLKITISQEFESGCIVDVE